jgi:hypothetical protein
VIGLLLIYFIGKAFYDLADKYEKSKWGYAILGVASYYFGLLLGGFIVGIAVEIFAPGTVTEFSDVALGLMAVPLGLLTCWGIYKLLERNWSNPPIKDNNDILDEHLMK